jgi:hypothetical protein
MPPAYIPPDKRTEADWRAWEDYAAERVAEFPPLTDDQRHRIASLMRPAVGKPTAKPVPAPRTDNNDRARGASQ